MAEKDSKQICISRSQESTKNGTEFKEQKIA